MSIALFLAVAAYAAQGTALLECGGIATEKSRGWRFEASGAKGGELCCAVFCLQLSLSPHI